jgi:hypothetical protein
MNVILNPGQSNTRKGDINLPSSLDLTGKENLLWKVVNNAGVPNFALPTAVTDFAVYVGASGDVIGNNAAAEVASTNENCRILLDGACNAGDALSLSPNKFGRLYKPGAGAGAVYYNFIAEEAGVDGQLLLVRRIGERTATL